MRTTLITIATGIISMMFLFTSCGNPEYENAINKADSLYSAKSYAPAKKHYQKALEFKPDEAYPQEQIEKIEQVMKEIARKKAKENEKKYKAYINKADKLFDNEEYKKAKNFYQKALDIKPQKQHPQNRIAEIDNLLAEAQAMKNYPYHIVVGCFEVDRNATNYHAKIKNNYSEQSRSIPILNGRMDAITYKSYKTLTDAYRALPEAQKIETNAWVLRK